MMEIWKDIIYKGIDYSGLYQVSNFGRVKSLEKKIIYSNGHSHTYPEKIMKQNLNMPYDGYQRYIVQLSKNGRKKVAKVHYLVAEAFIPYTGLNPDGTQIKGRIEINHKDHNSLNNNYKNLEWCDSDYNCHHANSRYVKCIETGEIFLGCARASRKLGLQESSIASAANPNHSQKTAAGYHWEYI